MNAVTWLIDPYFDAEYNIVTIPKKVIDRWADNYTLSKKYHDRMHLPIANPYIAENFEILYDIKEFEPSTDIDVGNSYSASSNVFTFDALDEDSQDKSRNKRQKTANDVGVG